MLTHFPQAVPEIPVSNVEKAAEYYANVLGFHFDWGNDEGGIGGISQGDCRMFLTNAQFREKYGTTGPAMIWLNLDGKEEVDQLYRRWQQAGAKISPSRRISRGACANSESLTWTTTNCASSMTLRRTCRRSTHNFVMRGGATETGYKFAPKASRRPSQSFTTNSRECQGVLPSSRVNSTPRAAYSA